MLRRLLLTLLALGLIVGVALGVGWWRSAQRSSLEKALDLLPADTLRASYTDWAGVRAALGAGTPSEPDDIRTLIDNAFSTDLSGASGIDESAVAMAIHFGFSPADLEWELLGQSRDGAVLLLKLPESTSNGQVASRLEGLGYIRPTADDGVWEGGPDVIARIDPTISPELQFITLLDDGLLIASDTVAYLEIAVDAARREGALDSDALAGLAGQVEDPLAAIAFVGDFACEALAMSQADPEQQAAAARMVDDAGGINPLQGLVVAAYDDRRLRVAMGFENDDQARQNSSSRALLASGPAPGQGQDFTDLFTVTSGTREGSAVILNLQAQPSAYAFSSLTSGPVLFESC